MKDNTINGVTIADELNKQALSREYADGTIRLTLTRTAPANPEIHYCPVCGFDIIDIATGDAVGSCELRVGHTYATGYCGNVSVTVAAKYRGQRIGVRALTLLFSIARGLGMDYLLITCDPENLATIRTCELAGCAYERQVSLPPDIEQYMTGSRLRSVYRKEL